MASNTFDINLVVLKKIYPKYVRTVWQAATNFWIVVKLVEMQIIYGQPRPLPWPIIFCNMNTDARPVCGIYTAAQCIVIGPVCVWVCGCVCLWVCHHENSKLRESILTKLGLQVKVVTISNWLNFGHSAHPWRGSAAQHFFGSALLQPARGVSVSPERFFINLVVITSVTSCAVLLLPSHSKRRFSLYVLHRESNLTLEAQATITCLCR